MSIPAKPPSVSSSTSTLPPLKATVWPADRPVASRAGSPTGNCRCSSTFSISGPTTPVAPTTATLKRREGDSATRAVYLLSYPRESIQASTLWTLLKRNCWVTRVARWSSSAFTVPASLLKSRVPVASERNSTS